MREILFKGRRTDNGEWIYGSLMINGEKQKSLYKDDLCFGNYYIIPETALDIIKTALNDKGHYMNVIGYHVIPETVGQYTGKEDKNGRKIFEGDICKDHKNENWEVKFGEYCDCSDGMQVGFYYNRMNESFCMLCYTYKPETFEVIGNVHDTELLGVSKQ